MGLNDLARFLAPKCPRRARAILQCFYGNDGGCTLADMMRETGMREKTLQYHLTKFRRWKLLWTERRHRAPAIYHLEMRPFHVRLDTVLIDPLRVFHDGQRQSGGMKGAEAAA